MRSVLSYLPFNYGASSSEVRGTLPETFGHGQHTENETAIDEIDPVQESRPRLDLEETRSQQSSSNGYDEDDDSDGSVVELADKMNHRMQDSDSESNVEDKDNKDKRRQQHITEDVHASLYGTNNPHCRVRIGTVVYLRSYVQILIDNFNLLSGKKAEKGVG